MVAKGWISEGMSDLGVIACAPVRNASIRNQLTIQALGYAKGVPNPILSVSINGKAAMAPTSVLTTGTIETFTVDTTAFEPALSFTIELLPQPQSYPQSYANMILISVWYQGSPIPVSAAEYKLPGSGIVNGNAVINPGFGAVFGAPQLPRNPPPI